MKRLLPVLMLIAFFPAPSASACSIVPGPPKTEEEWAVEANQHRQDLLEWGRNSEAIVRVKAISTSGYGESAALVKVLKTMRGKIRRGTILRLKTIDTGLCDGGTSSEASTV